MSEVDLKSLGEPVRVEAAKLELTSFMGQLQSDFGLSDTMAVSVLECVLGEQRSQLCKALSQQVIAYSNTLQQVSGELDELKAAETSKNEE